MSKKIVAPELLTGLLELIKKSIKDIETKERRENFNLSKNILDYFDAYNIAPKNCFDNAISRDYLVAHLQMRYSFITRKEIGDEIDQLIEKKTLSEYKGKLLFIAFYVDFEYFCIVNKNGQPFKDVDAYYFRNLNDIKDNKYFKEINFNINKVFTKGFNVRGDLVLFKSPIAPRHASTLEELLFAFSYPIDTDCFIGLLATHNFVEADYSDLTAKGKAYGTVKNGDIVFFNDLFKKLYRIVIFSEYNRVANDV